MATFEWIELRRDDVIGDDAYRVLVQNRIGPSSLRAAGGRFEVSLCRTGSNDRCGQFLAAHGQGATSTANSRPDMPT